jgi:hypothetical protein
MKRNITFLSLIFISLLDQPKTLPRSALFPQRWDGGTKPVLECLYILGPIHTFGSGICRHKLKMDY